jgi:hypothetical protein
MGSKTRRLRLKAAPVYIDVPPRFAMSQPGLLRSLLMAGLLQRFADRDRFRAFGIWPRCADGTRVHDMKGQPRCPACGFEPTLSKGTDSLPGHARASAEGLR